MPGTRPDGDDDGDAPPPGPPVHPDDRLWRHPSEVGWQALPPAGRPAPTIRPTRPRLWMVAATSGVAGAVLAVALVALVGGVGTRTPQRVVERVGVREQLADSLALRPTDGLADVAAAVIPSIVRLEVDTGGAEPTVGSGVVALDDGHIITNAHVVAGARSITILHPAGTAVAADIVGTDPATDIAVLAPAAGSPTDLRWDPAVRGSAGDLAVGEPAVVIGTALGLSGGPSVSLGVISGLDRRITTAQGATLHGMIQTDAPIAAGASGGALCDRAGRVVGITTSPAADEPSGLGFAIPIEMAWEVAEALIDDGALHRVWLGIEGSDLDATRSSLLGLTGTGGGTMVERVLAGSPAEEAGLQAGDVLTAIDGERLATMSDLVLALRGYRPGDAATLAVHRDGETIEIAVTLAER